MKVITYPQPEVEMSQSRSSEIAAEVRNLRLKFAGADAFIFKDLNLSIRKGEKVLLLGPSGCGKSTLLQVLSSMIPTLVEVPMKWDSAEIPKSWGVVFQDPDTQFCMPYVDEELAFVLENLGIPQEEMKHRMKVALQQVGLDLPELHVPIVSLSQGMKQRLALSSILLMEPEVLFLDEPSAMLDPEGRRQIWQSIKGAAEGRTVIIVEHRIEEVLDWVDRVVLIGPHGEIIGEGLPDEVFRFYRHEFRKYGVWYPGVWEEYINSAEGKQSLSFARPVNYSSLHKTEVRPLISLQDYCVYRGQKPMLTIESADVYPGDFIAITGPNGAGKSTLLLGLMGILTSEGQYVLEGQSLEQHFATKSGRKKVAKQARDRIGFVFQNPEFQFVEESVYTELAFSLSEAGMNGEQIEPIVQATVNQFGLQGLETRHPYQLSLGQKRRLSVATAMILEKRVLLLDEPTFGQDAANTWAILELCESLRSKGVAIVMVTHEEFIADYWATERWEIEQGKLARKHRTKRGSSRGSDIHIGEVHSK